MWHFGFNCIWLSLVICNSLITHYFDAVMRINSLVTGRFYFDFRQVIFKLTLVNGGWDISYEIALRWMPLDLIDKSTLVQVMAWCRQATSHYLSQCWPRSMSPNGVTRPPWVKDRAHLSTFKFFILEKFSCIVVLIVFFVIVQSSGLTSVWFREKMTFFLNFISFHIFAIYVGGACWGLPAACGLIAVSGARLPSVDGLTVRYIKNAPLLNLPSKYVCDLFQTCFRYMYVWYKHTGTLPLCLQVALSFIWLD